MKLLLPGVITSFFAIAVLAACGGGVPASERPAATPELARVIVVPDDTPLPIVEPAPIVETVSNLEIGSAVGERAPDFEVTFQDGSSVSREELAAEGRPAFLYFMATW